MKRLPEVLPGLALSQYSFEGKGRIQKSSIQSRAWLMHLVRAQVLSDGLCLKPSWDSHFEWVGKVTVI